VCVDFSVPLDGLFSDCGLTDGLCISRQSLCVQYNVVSKLLGMVKQLENASLSKEDRSRVIREIHDELDVVAQFAAYTRVDRVRQD
jgi:hypothetical protein